MLSAQYLVNCLKEDYVCHSITTEPPIPRPTKESLCSRHHSPVLHRLCTSRNERHQKLHTYAVDYAIQLQETEGASTHNIGCEAETELKTTMHPLTATDMTLPSLLMGRLFHGP